MFANARGGVGNGRPTAIFACSDMAAIGAMRALRELGLRVPHDVAVVAQPKYEIGKVAMSVLQNKIEKGRGKNVVMDIKLVVRESCGGKAHQALGAESL